MALPALFGTRPRAAIVEELRRLLPGAPEELRPALPFGLGAVDSHLPYGGLDAGALHEVVPETASATAAALSFIAAILDCAFSPNYPFVFILPVYGLRHCGCPYGHGFRALGLDAARLILVEPAHRKETLWAIEEALRSRAPAAVTGFIDKLDLKSSQRLHLAAADAGLPLFLLRPAPTLEASAAATRWRVGTALAARDRFGLFARARWHLRLERARNGRPGEWVMEYDHVAHCFSLAAALADPALSRRAGETSKTSKTSEQSVRQAS
jgi:protein ImuA